MERRRPLADAHGKQVEDAHRVALGEAGALGYIADAEFPAPSPGGLKGDLPLMLPLPQNGADQRGFACAVGADQGDDFPAVDVKIHVPENFVIADFNPQLFDFQAAVSAAPLPLMLFYAH